MTERQNLDCNCNDCFHMQRDFATQNKARADQLAWQQEAFDKRKARMLETANNCTTETNRNALIRQANALKFQPIISTIQYGYCGKFNKSITFIPNTCMIETQSCFKHRKEK